MSLSILSTLDITSNLDNSDSLDIVNNLDFVGDIAPSLGVEMGYENLDIMGYEPEDWFNVLWLQRIEFSIKENQVPSTQTNFPLLINKIYPELIGQTTAQIRFTGVDNIKLEYTIRKFDASTGLLIARMNKPTVSDSDIIRIYFDNPAAVDEQNENVVWDANFTSVHHLNGTGHDSTGNNQDLTLFGTTTVPAKIGDGLDFTGTVNDYLIRDSYTFPLDEITIKLWLKTTDSGRAVMSYAVGSASLAQHFLFFRLGDLFIFILNNGIDTNLILDDGEFHQVVITWRSSDGQFNVYVDGSLAFNAIHQQGVTFTNNGALVLGQEQDDLGGGFQASQAFIGVLNELEISKIVRSADYIALSFNNENDQAAFYSTSTVETIPLILMGYET